MCGTATDGIEISDNSRVARQFVIRTLKSVRTVTYDEGRHQQKYKYFHCGNVLRPDDGQNNIGK